MVGVLLGNKATAFVPNWKFTVRPQSMKTLPPLF